MTKIEAIITAQSGLIHGGQTLGTVQYLKRNTFLLPNGSKEDIPVVSGNAVRGALRDHAASLYHEFLDYADLSLPQMQLLWAGGSITKAKSEPLSGSRLRAVREVCPPFALFGGGIAGRVVSGTLSVGNMLPLCQELAHLLPYSVTATAELPSYWDITQLDEFSRFPDRAEDDEKTLLMRYGVESFVPGTRFYWWTKVGSRNDIEQAFFTELVQDFLTGEVVVGGNKSRGFGRLLGSPLSCVDFPVFPDWRDSLNSAYTRAEILDRLKEIQ